MFPQFPVSPILRFSRKLLTTYRWLLSVPVALVAA